MRTINLKYFFMLIKIDFISSRQRITAKFAQLRDFATVFIRVQNFCNLQQPRLVCLISGNNFFKNNENNQKVISG